MKILLSNDDGYRARGLLMLAEALLPMFEITVVAPAEDCSGASNSLTLRDSLRVRRSGNGFYYVDGTPADCVHFAINGMLDFQPDMVVAGINHGANLGDDVIYSGTVAAAIEGRFLGLPAVAVSLAGEEMNHYETAAEVVLQLLRRLADRPLPKDTILNINVPDRPLADLRGYRATRLGARHQSQPIIEQTHASELESSQPSAQRIFRIGPIGDGADTGAGTDFAAVEAGMVSVTPLQIDMTRHQSMDTIADWLADVHP